MKTALRVRAGIRKGALSNFFDSIWYVIIVGAIFIGAFASTEGNMWAGICYMTALTAMLVSKTAISNMWRKTARENGSN